MQSSAAAAALMQPPAGEGCKPLNRGKAKRSQREKAIKALSDNHMKTANHWREGAELVSKVYRESTLGR